MDTLISADVIPLWGFVLIFAISSIIGGMAGFIIFSAVYRRNKEKYLQISDLNLADEILNLRSRIQLVYLIGPLLGFLIAAFGLKGYEDIHERVAKKITDYDENTDKIEEATRKADEFLKSTDQIITEKKLIDRDYASRRELRTGITNLDTDIRRDYVHKNRLNDDVSRYLREEKFINERSLENQLGELTGNLDRKYVQTRTLDQYHSKDFVDSKLKSINASIQEFNENKANWVSKQNLLDANYIDENELKTEMSNYLKLKEMEEKLAKSTTISSLVASKLSSDEFKTLFENKLFDPETIQLLKQKLMEEKESVDQTEPVAITEQEDQ